MSLPNDDLDDTSQALPDWLSEGLREIYDSDFLEPLSKDLKRLLCELDQKTGQQ